jgi:multidrug resistance protein
MTLKLAKKPQTRSPKPVKSLMSPTLRIVLFINFINALSLIALILNIYNYGKTFGLSDFQTSFLFAIYSLSQFLAAPIIGKLSDRLGRKPLLIISLAGTVLANFMVGTANTASILFLARFLDGITGGNISVAQAIITDITEPEDRARAFGLFGASLGIGFVIGPLISYLTIKLSLGAPFLASSILAAIALIFTIWQLPETLKQAAPKTGNLFDLGLGKIFSGFAMPRVGALLMVTFLTSVTFGMFTFGFQAYYIKVLAQDLSSFDLLFFSFGILGALMQTIGIKFLTKKLNAGRILLLGLLFRSICFALMPMIPNVIYFVIVSLIFSIFNSLIQPMISNLISLNTKPSEQGMTSGLNAAYLSIATGIGPVLSALLVDKQTIEAAEKLAKETGAAVNINSYYSYGYPLYVAGICAFAVLLLAIYTRRQYNQPVANSSNYN